MGVLAAPAGAASKPPPTWDARIKPIAAKVEKLRGLEFDHPVQVDFLSEAAFEKKVAVDKGKLTKQEQREIETAQSQLRAVGLIGADVDIVDATSSLQTSGVLAYYDPKTKRVTVKGSSVDDIGLRVTLAHELTHALQDQHFDLQKLERSAARMHASTPLRTLVEGDAVRVQRAYVDSLSQADQRAYAQQLQQESATARAEIASKGVPESLSVLFEAPYDLGPIMIDTVLARRDEAGINALFRKPPTSDSSYLTPSTLLDGSTFTKVAPPKLVAGERAVGKPDVFGAFALYQVLASRLDPATALTAADAWGGDSMVTFTRKGVTCLRSTFVGRTGDGTHAIGDAITEWTAAMPAGTASTTVRAGRATLTACDPGASATEAPNRAVAALLLAVSRDELFLEALQQKLPVSVSMCTADGLVRDPAFQPILDSGANDPGAGPDQAALDAVRARVPEIVSECRASNTA